MAADEYVIIVDDEDEEAVQAVISPKTLVRM